MSSRPPAGPEFVDVTRGPLVESVHRIAACVTDAGGDIVLEIGETSVPVFLRSAAKPFIAAAIVREGVVERFGFDEREIAIVAGSHNGEPEHVETVRSILAKIGMTEDALQCGAHRPYDDASARALDAVGAPARAVHNNCSGKHAGILAMCKVMDIDARDYLSPDNAAEQRILDFCSRVAGERRPPALATDGCGIPVYAVSLRAAARSFAALSRPDGCEPTDAHALATVRNAMAAQPWYVGGTNEFDTCVGACDGVVAKSGAEGMFGAAFPERGWGMALKVLDGAARAVPPAAMAIMEQLSLLDEPVRLRLRTFARPAVVNRAGRIVGAVETRDATRRP